MNDLDEKYRKMRDIIGRMDSVIVAFSGGVDSTCLLKVCYDLLGDKVLAVTAISPTYPAYELEEAKKLVSLIGCRHVLVDSEEMTIEGFTENSPRRCYFCKSELFGKLKEMAQEREIDFILDGSNCDDMSDYRPGRDAARELEVVSPLIEAGLHKGDIRLLSKKLGLPIWNKPSFACLSSRIPYGTSITPDRIKLVEKCEEYLRDMSFCQFRVRYHGDLARIEVEPDEFGRLIDNDLRKRVIENFKKNGFKYVTLDMEGYRTGSMN